MTEKKIQLNIYQKLVDVRKSVQYLQKDQKSYGYNYVAGSSVISSLRAKLDENCLLLVPNIIEEKKCQVDKEVKGKKKKVWILELKMNMVWINADNPDEVLMVPFYAFGEQDDISKAFGSALTYTERYFLLKFFNIATDKDDPDFFNNKQSRGKNRQPPLPQNYTHQNPPTFPPQNNGAYNGR